MGSVRRARAFTLIEVMVVVALVGILAVVAGVAYRKWVLNSYIGEAQNMLGNIRSAEETFKAENGGYLSISADLTVASTYPSATPRGNLVTAWGNNPPGWATLNINPSAPVRFGYAVIAANTAAALPNITNNGLAVNLTPMAGQPWWYVAVAICDVDSDGAGPDTTIYGVSGTNQLFTNNEGL